ncbi:hypothetical protein BBJ28_00020591 [Nothophytophthora sp. Chile5]|nr:hypothetical protein BBJ28_00020591 [Nothophytophthora sp. Chile5]
MVGNEHDRDGLPPELCAEIGAQIIKRAGRIREKERLARLVRKAKKRKRRSHERKARLALAQERARHKISANPTSTRTDAKAVVTEPGSAARALEDDRFAAAAQYEPIREEDVVMSVPSKSFLAGKAWGTQDVDTMHEVKARQEVLKNGFARLAVAEADRMENLAAGCVIDEHNTREDVARQLVATAAGMEAMIGVDEWVETDETSL